MNLKRLIVPGIVAGAIAVALTMPIGAEDNITTTVTPLVLSVNVTPGSFDYGELEFSQDNSTRSKASSDSFTVMNTGSVASDIEIRGSDATPEVITETTWEMDCSPAGQGTVAANQFVHRFAFGDSPDFGGGGAALCDEANKVLATDVIVGGSFGFGLEMNMPTSSTGLSERSTTVTVIAVQATP